MASKLQGIDLDAVLKDGLNNHVTNAIASLSDAERTYHQNRPLKWAVFAGFLVAGIVFGIEVPKITNMLGASKYSRKSLDNIMHTLLGAYKFP